MTGIQKRILDIVGYMSIKAELQPDGSGDLQIGSHTIPFALLLKSMDRIEDLDGTVRRVSIHHLWPESLVYCKELNDEKFLVSADNLQINISVRKEDIKKLFIAACCECLGIEDFLAYEKCFI